MCAQFVALCRELDLFADACVAIDGSKFKAVNSRGRIVTRSKMKRRLEEIEKKLDRYLQRLDTADRQEPSVARRRPWRVSCRDVWRPASPKP